MTALEIITLGAPAAGLAFAAYQVRRRGLDRWIPSYVLRVAQGIGRPATGPVHMLLCVADHFEPQWGGADAELAAERVEHWTRDYPRLFGEFRDADGRPPRHSFFFPLEEYDPDHIDALADLCREGFGEVEVHLHHDHDNSANLRRRLIDFRETLATRHGLLARRNDTGELTYGFIHGNWALDNSRPDGRWCGVNDELDVLRETGCYADFTLPSAPSPTQTRKINSIYYATDDPDRPKSHDRGRDVGVGPQPEKSLLLIQGPLVLNWKRRKWGLFPRVENGCIQGTQSASIGRVPAWLSARVQVPSRPDWYFVKLHTHGAPEANRRVLLGEPMVRFHNDLATQSARNPNFHYHYVTARELYNLARAAESGWTGTVDEARDFELTWGGRVEASATATPQPWRIPR